MNGRRHHPMRGFTLVELMVTLAVAAVLSMLAAPSFSAMYSNLRVQGMASELAADLQYARSEAVRRRADVQLASDADGLGYAIRTGTETVKSVRFSTGVSIGTGASATYSALRALAGESAFTLAGTSGASLRISTNAMGRVSLCSPGGTIKGYTTC
jgi:type IV fimbrial biogenesis protein FimT